MIINVLLAGPSLANLTELPPADVTIAAKRAAIVFPADWLIILDSRDLSADWLPQVKGQPRLLTRREYRPKYTTRPGTDCETLEGFLPHMPSAWGCFSSAAALVLASYLGAKSIDVFGADFGEGERLEEFDGFVSPEARYTPERWDHEKKVWQNTIDALGVQVTRHGLARRH